MTSLKRKIYGLPLLRWYRLHRARQIARQPRRVAEGFSFASNELAFTDSWESEERAVAARLLPHCAAMVDIGANTGFYSLLANHLGKPALAVEPDAGNLIILRRNAANADVEIAPIALSDTDQTTVLYGDGDMASLDPDWQGVGKYFRQTVTTTTLDALLRGRWAGQRLFIKIDVEGAEALVLAGAQETLHRSPSPYWLIETFPNFPNGQPNPAHQATLDAMNGYGVESVGLGNYLFSRD